VDKAGTPIACATIRIVGAPPSVSTFAAAMLGCKNIPFIHFPDHIMMRD